MSKGPSEEQLFSRLLEEGEEVFEIELEVSPRDVHFESRSGGSGQWKVNEKAKRNAEVSFRELNENDRKDFLEAMGIGVGSYLERGGHGRLMRETPSLKTGSYPCAEYLDPKSM